MALVGNLAVNGIEPRNLCSYWILPKGSATWKATPSVAYWRAALGDPGSESRSRFTLCHQNNQGYPDRLLVRESQSRPLSKPDKLKKQGKQMTVRESDRCIVPVKPGNSGGGKAATLSPWSRPDIGRTQRRILRC